MKKSWTAFYVDKYQSSYIYDTEKNKLYKCPNDFKFPTWIMYLVLFLGAVLGDLLNRLFMPPKNEVIAYLIVAVVLIIGCIAVYFIMKYISKVVDGLVYELNISPELIDEYIDRGRKKFKKDIMIISITIGISFFILVLSVWLFFAFHSTHILIITALTWVLILLCGFGFQPVKRYKIYKNGISHCE